MTARLAGCLFSVVIDKSPFLMDASLFLYDCIIGRTRQDCLVRNGKQRPSPASPVNIMLQSDFAAPSMLSERICETLIGRDVRASNRINDTANVVIRCATRTDITPLAMIFD